MPNPDSRRKLLIASVLVLCATANSPGGECVTWEGTPTSPERRFWHAMAFDSRRGVTVLHGGYGDSSLLSTWEWDGRRWEPRTTRGPVAPINNAMCFDTRRGVTVLYAGSEQATWEWDGEQWTRAEADGPDYLDAVQLAFDVRRGHSILVGRAPWYPYSFQTWAWDGEHWTQCSEDSVGIWRSFGLAYDQRRGVTVLLAQYNDSSALLEWDGNGWQLRDTTSLPSLHSFEVAYDARRGKTVIYGSSFEGPNTWEWDGEVLTAHSPDAERGGNDNYAMAYDSRRGVIVLVGLRVLRPDNTAKTRPATQTWEWDGRSWTLRQTVLWNVSGHAACYDRDVALLLAYTGQGSNDYPTILWQWDGHMWTWVQAAGPSSLSNPLMVFDELRHVTVLYGLDYNYEPVSETWEWNGSTWGKRWAESPPARERAGVAYDADRGLTLLFGGYFYDHGPYDELWQWDGVEWRLASVGGPPPRASHAMAYDRSRQRLVVFGGEWSDRDSRTLLGDTWEWNGSAWTLKSTTGPTPRANHAMAFDEARGVTVLYGGSDGETYGLADAWGWDGDSWFQLPVSGPSPRDGHVLVYDPVRQCVLLHGGGRSDESARMMWELGLHDLPQDADDDCDVDLGDYAAFQACFGRPRANQDCAPLDSDASGQVDAVDLAAFTQKLSGPAGP